VCAQRAIELDAGVADYQKELTAVQKMIAKSQNKWE
jgi:hypothetical protein